MMVNPITTLLLSTLSLTLTLASPISFTTNNYDDPLIPINPTPPTHYGVLLFRAFELLDIYGPLDILQLLAHNRHLTLSLLARTMDPVTTKPAGPTMNPYQSDFWPSITPTHTFAHPPEDIEVLIVPGGPGARSTDLEPEVDFIRRAFPKLKYLVTICSGAGIAARSGVLDGYRVTTNKAAWNQVTPLGPKVKWTVPARWVDDGKVWSSSGVTAGMDLFYAFLKAKYPNGTALAERFQDITEFTPITNSTYDPWAAKFNVTAPKFVEQQ